MRDITSNNATLPFRIPGQMTEAPVSLAIMHARGNEVSSARGSLAKERLKTLGLAPREWAQRQASWARSTVVNMSILRIAFVSLAALASAAEGSQSFKRQTSQIRSSYDFVIVGAGTSGLTIADRLSQALPSSKLHAEVISTNN